MLDNQGWRTAVRGLWALILVLPMVSLADGLSQDPLTLLRQLSQAAHEQSYQGTFVIQRGSDMESSQVAHGKLDGQEFTRVQVLDGRPREIVRTGQETRCYYPAQHKLRLESGYRRRLFPALIEPPYDHYLDLYTVSWRGLTRVADHECRLIYFQARDMARFDHEFCVDSQSALILKAVTLDSNQVPLETELFTTLNSNFHPHPDAFRSGYQDMSGWKTVRFPMSEVSRQSPVRIGYVPAGYTKVLEMEVQPPKATAPIRHWVFSDGLSSFSVFLRDQTNAEAGAPVSRVLNSALSYYSGSLQPYHVVVLGEIPQETVRSIGQSISLTEEKHP